MGKNIFWILLAFLVLEACNNSDSKAKLNDKYEQTKHDLQETEKENPARFLTITGYDKKNLLGQTVIKGTLVNKAKVCSYKDIEIELLFYSKTGVLLEQDKETIFEIIAPGSSKNFKTKYFAPKGTDSVALKIIKAVEGS